MLSVPDKRNLYSKGYPTNWKGELFDIVKLDNTIPVTYSLEDENTEQTEGTFFDQELLGCVFNFGSNNKNFESMEFIDCTQYKE